MPPVTTRVVLQAPAKLTLSLRITGVRGDGYHLLDAEMVMGYLHRSMEKLAEERTYTQNIPFTDRTDYLASMSNNLGYCLAVEKLAGIDVPERGSAIRVIMAELQRLASHCMAVGAFTNDTGAWQTPIMSSRWFPAPA